MQRAESHADQPLVMKWWNNTFLPFLLVLMTYIWRPQEPKTSGAMDNHVAAVAVAARDPEEECTGATPPPAKRGKTSLMALKARALPATETEIKPLSAKRRVTVSSRGSTAAARRQVEQRPASTVTSVSPPARPETEGDTPRAAVHGHLKTVDKKETLPPAKRSKLSSAATPPTSPSAAAALEATSFVTPEKATLMSSEGLCKDVRRQLLKHKVGLSRSELYSHLDCRTPDRQKEVEAAVKQLIEDRDVVIDKDAMLRISYTWQERVKGMTNLPDELACPNCDTINLAPRRGDIRPCRAGCGRSLITTQAGLVVYALNSEARHFAGLEPSSNF